ncbi:uncharacterized protein LOC128175432 [Crassostrea angulata]|uniref:uncharacterized protein LOC128175432 n=1 Tax=Magallana angulata TaxID=2784310 RepID=UPI0022B21593|nr:uncharacterized protein LOC128175432 [Crassostrea angulata]
MKLSVLLVVVLCMIFHVRCDLATESDAYAVEIIIYRLTTDTWTANSMESTFSGTIASAANTYCGSNVATCGLETCCTSAFKETDVGKISDYPKKDLKNLKHKFYLKFPTGSTASNSSVTQYVVVNSAVYEIIRLARTTFNTQTGYWITWADETYYGVPATTTENQIIIPIAFVVLFLVIFLAIGLHFWNKRKQKEARIQKKIKDKKALKKNQAMVQPTYRVDPEIKDLDEDHHEKTKESPKKPRYIIAVSDHDVYPFFPYVSDTGTLPPESCVFGQFLNIAALLRIVTVIVGKSKLGPSTILTREWSPEYAGYAEHVVSTVMEWLGTFLICAFALTFVPEFKQYGIAVYNGNVKPDFPYIRFTKSSSSIRPGCWTTKEPGMSACLASTISEWIISFLTCIYVATFTPEFKYFELIKAKILFHELTRNNEVPGNENSEETQSNGTVETNVVVVHLIGAFFAFGMGLVYCCLQTYLSFKLPDIPGSSRNLRVGRLAICILDAVFILTLMIAAAFTIGERPNNPRKWTPDEPMYGAHLTSTISEWLMAFLTCLYLATFTPEFKYFEMIKPEIMFRDTPGVSAIRITKDIEPQTGDGPVKFSAGLT